MVSLNGVCGSFSRSSCSCKDKRKRKWAHETNGVGAVGTRKGELLETLLVVDHQYARFALEQRDGPYSFLLVHVCWRLELNIDYCKTYVESAWVCGGTSTHERVG